MKKFLFLIIAMVCTAVNVQAYINVWPTSTNGVEGYGIYNWDNPGDVAAFLKGEYQGVVYNGSSEDTNWNALDGLLSKILKAKTVKLGGNADAPKEPISTDDLKALELLTGVQYLRLDNCFAEDGTDFSQIVVGGSSLLDITLPTGVTKDQIKAASNALKGTHTSLKTASAISGTVKTETTNQYWYELNGQKFEYTGADAAEGATVTLTNYDVEVPLKPAEGYPVVKYTNSKNNSKSESATANDVIIDNKIIPEKVPVALTENSISVYTYNGVEYKPEDCWWLDSDGKVNSDYSGISGLKNGDYLTGTTTYTYTYKFRRTDWGATDEDTYLFDGEPLTDLVDGHKYALIPNLQSETHRYQFDITTSKYLYTYVDPNDGETKNYPAEGEADSPYESITIPYNGTVGPLTMKTEVTKELTVDGATIYVNVAGSMADVEYMFTNAQNINMKSAKNVTVIGEMNSNDVNTLGMFTARELVNLSDASFKSGAKGDDVIKLLNDQCSGQDDAKRNVALVQPTNQAAASTTDGAGTVNQHEVWYNLNYNAYKNLKCIAYFADAAKTDLRVYGTDATVAKLQPLVKSGETSVTFEYAYAADPAKGMAGALPADNSTLYPQAESNFLSEGVSTLPAVNVNFNVMNISNLGMDFSSLNPETHYIVIPTNTTTSKESETVTRYPGFNDETRYKYPSSVYVVATYKDTVVPYSNNCSYSDFQYVATEPTTITYVRPTYGTGHLSGAANYIPDYMLTATRMNVIGTLNSDDVATLGDVHATTVDLVRATISNSDLASLNSKYVEYLGLPDGANEAIAATDADHFAFKTSCPMLKALGAYDPTTKTYTFHSTERTVTYGEGVDGHNNKIVASQENSIYRITNMCAPSTNREAGSAKGTENVVATGYLTLDDIHVNGGTVTGTTTNEQGQTVNTQTGQAGLESNNSGTIVNADFKNAVFLDNSHMNFMGGLAESSTEGVGACWSNSALATMVLPTAPRVHTIPRGALNNCKLLKDICIPYNYEHLCDGVFDNGRLDHITTTDANGALVDNGPHTFTFSANIKELGEKPAGAMQKVAAQVFPHNTVVYEVYCLAATTPKCYRDVFPANMLAGWGSFNDKIYSREKYMGDPDSDDGSGTYTVLRFPSEESYATKADYDKNAKLYTDVNKVYTKKDQTGAVDANGNAPLWPTQREAYRSFAQASLGLTWNDWQTGYDINLNVNGPNGKLTGDGGGYKMTDAEESLTTSIDETQFNYMGSIHAADHDGDYDFPDYEGWHQFVLTMANYVEPTEKVVNKTIIRDYEEAGWYTLCVPFDLTVDQVTDMFGVPASNDAKKIECRLNGVKQTKAIIPDIRQLQKVTRKNGLGKENNVVNFILTKNLYENGKTSYLDFDPANSQFTTVDATAGEGNANRCIVGGRPYIVKAYKRINIVDNVDEFKIKGQNLGKMIMTRFAAELTQEASCVHNGADYYEQLGSGDAATLQFAKPYEQHKVRAVADAKESTPLNYTNAEGKECMYIYTMVGQFWQQPLPLYSIYMSKGSWYRYTGKKDKNGNLYTWDPYKCIILATEEVKDGKGGGFRNEEKTVYPEVKTQGTATDYIDKTFKIEFLDGRDDDDFNKKAAARYVFSFDEDIMELGDDNNQTTAIERIDGEELVPAHARIYTVAGQYAGRSVQGLSKGLYIVNGKKIVVK